MKIILDRVLVLILLALNTLSGQSLWTQWSDRIVVRAEYLRSNLQFSTPGYDMSTQIVILSGKIPLKNIVRCVVEVPFVWETFSSPSTGETKNGVGNFYIGCELGELTSPILFEIGARPVLRQDLKFRGFIGYHADFDRGEIYEKEMASYQIMLNVKSPIGQPFVYRVRFGSTVWLPERGTAIPFFDYGAKIGYDIAAISVHAGVTGRLNTKEDHGKASFHHLGFNVGYHFDTIRPALFYRIPLDKEISDLVKQTIGGSLSVEI